MQSPVTIVKKKQCSWADGQGIETDHSGYTFKLDDNLYVPLSDASRLEYNRGDGGELGTSDRRGKMQALHSSSALACNVFEYWRGRNSAVLEQALNLSTGALDIEFERKFPTGLPGNAPNLDVVLTCADGSIIAIESKFLEPYGSRHETGFKDKYFGAWGQSGYSKCQELAFRLQSREVVFRWLNAEQLLKHILGLTKSSLRWKLLYLWFEVPGPATDEHKSEVNKFANIMEADDIEFQSISYQVLFSAMLAHTDGADSDYLSYLGNRYFEEPIKLS
jgi:hypothetical protein